MAGNLFDNAKFGDIFLTTENKQAVFLRFAEHSGYKFAILYVEGWGTVQVVRENGREIYGDICYDIIRKQEEYASEDLEYASEKYACRFSGSKYGHDKVKDAFIAGDKWKEEQLMKDAFDVEVKIDAGGYPYIPQIELYDYDKDEPLAEEDDVVKVLIIKK